MITVRKPQFEFEETAPSKWYANNRFASTLFATLSATFPAGEKFFIMAVRDTLPPDAPQIMVEAAKAFTNQEAQHSLRHIEFNKWLESKGYDIDTYEAWISDALKIGTHYLSPKFRLAITCALEHITSILAERLIHDGDKYSKEIYECFRDFWCWHALEEEEHKAVAFDVYRENDYDEATRIWAMIFSTIALIVGIGVGQVYLSMSKPGGWSITDTIRGINILYGINGIITRSLPTYFDYYRIGFHPNDRG